MEIQQYISSDIMMALMMHPADYEYAKKSLELTQKWLVKL